MAEGWSKYTDHKKKFNTGSHQTQTANATENKASLLTAGLKFWLTLVCHWKELKRRHKSPSSILIRSKTQNTRGNSATCNICN